MSVYWPLIYFSSIQQLQLNTGVVKDQNYVLIGLFDRSRGSIDRAWKIVPQEPFFKIDWSSIYQGVRSIESQCSIDQVDISKFQLLIRGFSIDLDRGLSIEYPNCTSNIHFGPFCSFYFQTSTKKQLNI